MNRVINGVIKRVSNLAASLPDTLAFVEFQHIAY